jgi:hypothetical protein
MILGERWIFQQHATWHLHRQNWRILVGEICGGLWRSLQAVHQTIAPITTNPTILFLMGNHLAKFRLNWGTKLHFSPSFMIRTRQNRNFNQGTWRLPPGSWPTEANAPAPEALGWSVHTWVVMKLPYSYGHGYSKKIWLFLYGIIHKPHMLHV